MERWSRGHKVKKLPHRNVKVPLHLWAIHDGCLTFVESIGVYAIHENGYLRVVIKSTVSIFNQSTGNNKLAFVQVYKLQEDESFLLPITGEAM